MIRLHGNGGSSVATWSLFMVILKKEIETSKFPFIKNSKDFHPLIFKTDELLKA